jgi:hypothetical protein
MARKRVMDPDIFTGEAFTSLTNFDRVLYLGLWLHADDEGRMKASAIEIKLKIFPRDDGQEGRSNVTAQQCVSSLNRIAHVGLIRVYRHGDKPYLHVRGLRESQPLKWYTKSTLPEPPTTETTLCAGQVTDGPSVTVHGDGLREEERRGEESIPLPNGNGAGATAPTEAPNLPGIDPAPVTPTAKRQRKEVSPEAHALEAEARGFLGDFKPEFERRVGYPPELKIAEVQLVRALLKRLGRERTEIAATRMLDRHEAGTLVWQGQPKAPTVKVLHAMADDLLVEADRAAR